MSRDQEGVDLVKRVEELRIAFLPAEFSDTGLYENQEEIDDWTSAFIVLCHAEFEEFIEEIARDQAQSALDVWETRTPTVASMALLAHHYNPDPVARNAEAQKRAKKQKDNGAESTSSQTLSYLLNKVVKSHISVIDNNQGIRRKNIRAMFEPLGVDVSEIDFQILNDLEKFGLRRGNVAHHSISSRDALDPKKIYEDAISIAETLDAATFEP